MESAIQFPLNCESIPRSKLITTATAGFCSSSCASYSPVSKARTQNVAATPFKGSAARFSTIRNNVATKASSSTGKMPVGPTARMPVLLLRLYPIPHRNSFRFGHRTKIGAFRCCYPVRPWFILLARFCAQLELDKLACTSLALD